MRARSPAGLGVGKSGDIRTGRARAAVAVAGALSLAHNLGDPDDPIDRPLVLLLKQANEARDPRLRGRREPAERRLRQQVADRNAQTSRQLYRRFEGRRPRAAFDPGDRLDAQAGDLRESALRDAGPLA